MNRGTPQETLRSVRSMTGGICNFAERTALDQALPVQESGRTVIEARPLRYMQSLPPGHGAAEQKWPVLMFLHGYDEAAPLEIRHALTRHGPLRGESSPLASEGFIIVAPQLPRAGDLWFTQADAVQQIAIEVQQKLGGDPQRTYLSGFSFGGNGVFDLAATQPDFWAALWPVDPTRVPDVDPRRPVWLSFGEAARRGKQSFVRALELSSAESATPGDRVYLDEGQDHVGSARFAYKDDRIYRWLLSRQLGSQAP